MAKPEGVSRLPVERLPEQVVISGTPDLRLSPNQMRALKAETGKTLDELMGEGADDADRMQAIAWLELRRAGHDVRWADVADVLVELRPDEPDPSSGEPSPSSPPSADSGA